jgi:hypothetical protein
VVAEGHLCKVWLWRVVRHRRVWTAELLSERKFPECPGEVERMSGRARCWMNK